MNLVLLHGLFGFAHVGPIAYFNGVQDHLKAIFPGLRILVTQVDPVRSIEFRGTQLREQILQGLQTEDLDPNERVHIIAHSMGGLDARFLLSPDNGDNIADRIISLTTIATPHKGSPIADVLIKIKDCITEEEKLLFQSLSATLSQAHIPEGAIDDLTSDGVKRFNDKFRDNDKTKKFSVAGVGRGREVLGIPVDTCVALRMPYHIIKDLTGEANDGLVSLSSATWAGAPELWPADHLDEIGHNLDLGPQGRPTHFDYLAKYEALVDRLRQL